MTEEFELAGKVAVITGAASGLGRALANLCAEAGMKLILADVDLVGLESVGNEIASRGPCHWRQVDVRHREDLDSLADFTYRHFGAAHAIFNNAGVVVARSVRDTTPADCKWMMDVNFWGVFHGITAFLPRMLQQPDEGRIVNTASAAGFVSAPNLAAYCASKHAVVTYSECLQKELSETKANVGVTIVSPAFIPTNITKSQRWRPAELVDSTILSPSAQLAQAQLEKAVGSGRLTADDVARAALDGVLHRHPYVFPHRKIRVGIEERMTAVYGFL